MITFQIPAMSCGHCVRSITEAVQATDPAAQVQADLARINADQDRIRKNLRETPEKAEVYTKYLAKLSDQEKELDALTDKQKKLMTDEFTARKSYEDYLGALND